MPRTSGSVEIHYDVDGAPDDPLVVLIAGGGAQLTTWHEDFRALLLAERLRVVRIDNRDVGLSQRFGGPEDVDGGYDLADMADDVLRVLDHLGAEAAHLTGHSMGGMIAQMCAIEHPDRVRSLSLLSTIPGRSPRYVLHGPRDDLRQPPPRLSRDEAVAAAVAALHAEPASRFTRDEESVRRTTGENYDRAYSPDGFARQWAALLRAPERLDRLRDVTVPVLALHGREDGVLHWHSALDIAEAIADAELQVHAGMGHLIPRELWPQIVDAVTRTVRRGEEQALGGARR